MLCAPPTHGAVFICYLRSFSSSVFCCGKHVLENKDLLEYEASACHTRHVNAWVLTQWTGMLQIAAVLSVLSRRNLVISMRFEGRWWNYCTLEPDIMANIQAFGG